jgi:hypothetical protein
MEFSEPLDRRLCISVKHDHIERPDFESRCWRLDFHPHHHAQKGSRTQPASYLMCIKSYFPGVKWSKADNDH